MSKIHLKKDHSPMTQTESKNRWCWHSVVLFHVAHAISLEALVAALFLSFQVVSS